MSVCQVPSSRCAAAQAPQAGPTATHNHHRHSQPPPPLTTTTATHNHHYRSQPPLPLTTTTTTTPTTTTSCNHFFSIKISFYHFSLEPKNYSKNYSQIQNTPKTQNFRKKTTQKKQILNLQQKKTKKKLNNL